MITRTIFFNTKREMYDSEEARASVQNYFQHHGLVDTSSSIPIITPLLVTEFTCDLLPKLGEILTYQSVRDIPLRSSVKVLFNGGNSEWIKIYGTEEDLLIGFCNGFNEFVAFHIECVCGLR